MGKCMKSAASNVWENICLHLFSFFFRTINMAQTRTAMKSGSYGWTMWRMVNMSFFSFF